MHDLVLKTLNWLFKNMGCHKDVLDNPLPEEPAADALAAERNAYRRAIDKDREVSYLMLACMESKL